MKMDIGNSGSMQVKGPKNEVPGRPPGGKETE